MSVPKSDKARIRKLESQLRDARDSRDRWRERYEKERQQLLWVLREYKHGGNEREPAAPLRWS